MAKCNRCHKRKAKRHCIALGVDLCSLCCGLIREKEIHCPPNCLHLKKHKSYQEKRIITRKETSLSVKELGPDDILKDERMAWLAFHIEAPLAEFAARSGEFKDKDTLLALEYAKKKVEKGRGLIFMAEEKPGPKNEVGEAVYQSLEDCHYEKKIIIPGQTDTYQKEEKIKCLDRIILSVKFWAKGNFDGRGYIEKLFERLERVKALSNQKKILIEPKI